MTLTDQPPSQQEVATFKEILEHYHKSPLLPSGLTTEEGRGAGAFGPGVNRRYYVSDETLNDLVDGVASNPPRYNLCRIYEMLSAKAGCVPDLIQNMLNTLTEERIDLLLQAVGPTSDCIIDNASLTILARIEAAATAAGTQLPNDALAAIAIAIGSTGIDDDWLDEFTAHAGEWAAVICATTPLALHETAIITFVETAWTTFPLLGFEGFDQFDYVEFCLHWQKPQTGDDVRRVLSNVLFQTSYTEKELIAHVVQNLGSSLTAPREDIFWAATQVLAHRDLFAKNRRGRNGDDLSEEIDIAEDAAYKRLHEVEDEDTQPQKPFESNQQLVVNTCETLNALASLSPQKREMFAALADSFTESMHELYTLVEALTD